MEKELRKIDELLENGVITADEHKLLRSKIINDYMFTDGEKISSEVDTKIEILKKDKFKIKRKTIVCLVSILMLIAVIFSTTAMINHNRRLEEQREFALVQERYLSYMDTSSSWNCDGDIANGFTCTSGDNRAFTFGSNATMISFDRRFSNLWATIGVHPDNRFSCYYGTAPYYECDINDVNGIITVTFDEYFSGQAIAIERITALYLIIKDVDANS